MEIVNKKLRLKMYFLHAIFVFSLGISLGWAYPESALEDQDRECIKLLNLTAAFVVQSFDKYNLLREGDVDVNKFVNCTWTLSGYLSKDGIINPDALVTWMEHDVVKNMENNQTEVTANKVVDSCKSIKGDDSGDTGVKVYNCMMRTYLILINLI